MKLIKLRLVLDVDFDPQGLTAYELAANLRGIVHNAVGNGTFTGDTPATVEKYDYTVTVRKPRKKQNRIRASYPNASCPDCGKIIPKNVKDGQSCLNCGHVFVLPTPDEDAEQQRRDEKHGLYGGRTDVAN